MKYTELSFKVEPPEPGKEILIALLADVGFESFEETPDGLKAYIPMSSFKASALKVIEKATSDSFSFSYTIKNIENTNWNAVWESNYESITIDNRVYIYAPFHKAKPEVEYSILIEPKMSFGTAHHETTSLMISMMLREDFKNISLLDMGCGTAILAILAEKMGASEILAIDNDENAYENSLENLIRNNCVNITVAYGGAEKIKGMNKVILANINKNILLHDMEVYSLHLVDGGKIFFSGFYHNDLNDIEEQANKLGLQMDTFEEKNNWVCARFIKHG